MFAIGQQPQPGSTSMSVKDLNRPKDSRMTALLETLNRSLTVLADEDSMAGVFGRLVTRRNCTLHHADVEGLSETVAQVLAFFERHSQLKDCYRRKLWSSRITMPSERLMTY